MSEYFHGEIGDKARRSGDAHMVLILQPQSVFTSRSTTKSISQSAHREQEAFLNLNVQASVMS